MRPEKQPVLHAPIAALPASPAGWIFFCNERDLRRGPVAVDHMDRRLVGFRSKSARIGILDARCQHLGADLSRGRVIDECLECPYHHWQYAIDGRCKDIPQSLDVPAFARQKSYPVETRHGLVFMWNGPRPLYPLPFFEDLACEECACAGPRAIELDCPWHIVGANAFDSQHLYSVHERVLQEPPQIRHRGPFALSSQTVVKVSGQGWYDRFIRLASGPVATMTATNWSGSLIFVRVQLERTTTYGMVSLQPLGKERVRAHVFAFLPCSRSALSQKMWDPLRTALRLYFIGQFLRDDAVRLQGIRSGAVNLIDADVELARYFQWLARTANGLPGTVEDTESQELIHYQGARL